MNEKELATTVVQQLSDDFIFLPEVRGTHFSGKELRIDYLMKPKSISSWKNKNICFGIEFKNLPNLDKQGDTIEFKIWLAQCIDY